MAPGMAGEEDDVVARESALNVDIRGRAERGVKLDVFGFRESGELVQTAAADDSDGRGLRHEGVATES